MEEEEEEEKKMKEEKKSEKSTMELLFDYVKEEEKKGDKSEFRFVVKHRNLENNPPTVSYTHLTLPTSYAV